MNPVHDTVTRCVIDGARIAIPPAPSVPLGRERPGFLGVDAHPLAGRRPDAVVDAVGRNGESVSVVPSKTSRTTGPPIT